MAFVTPQSFKDRANNLYKTYAEKIFSQAQKVLPAADLLEIDQVKRCSDIMELFGDKVPANFILLRK